jgi:hypothetical protein
MHHPPQLDRRCSYEAKNQSRDRAFKKGVRG